MASQGIVASPNPVKLPSRFAADLGEAEEAILSKPTIQFKEATIRTLFSEKRTLSNSSSASSNAATLVNEEREQEELSPTQKLPCNDDRDCSVETTYTRFKRLISTISFPKPGLRVTGEVFVEEQCDESYPLGWPRLAAFQNQSDSCAVYRRFGLLFCRLLLQLQGELTLLEEKLLQLDKQDAADVNKHYRLRTSDDDATWDPAKREILKEIQEKLSTYGNLLYIDARLRELGPVPSRNHRNVYNWMRQHRPLDKGYDDFILRKDDFVSPVKKSEQGSSINDAIEATISRWPKFPLKALFVSKDQTQDQKEKGMHFFSYRRIAFVANVTVVCIAISILLIPIFVLYMVNTTRLQSSGVVLAFTVLFATMISMITEPKVESVFMSTCGYCAVLVVFLGNVQQQYSVPGPPSSGQG